MYFGSIAMDLAVQNNMMVYISTSSSLSYFEHDILGIIIKNNNSFALIKKIISIWP